jgi:uncharacterized protein DUF6587
MNRILDNSVVGLALLASAGYALSSLGPKGLRTRLFTALAQLAARAPKCLHLGPVARRLQGAAAKTSGSCGGCGSCGSASSAPDQPADSDVRVPLARVGRRN